MTSVLPSYTPQIQPYDDFGFDESDSPVVNTNISPEKAEAISSIVKTQFDGIRLAEESLKAFNEADVQKNNDIKKLNEISRHLNSLSKSDLSEQTLNKYTSEQLDKIEDTDPLKEEKLKIKKTKAALSFLKFSHSISYSADLPEEDRKDSLVKSLGNKIQELFNESEQRKLQFQQLKNVYDAKIQMLTNYIASVRDLILSIISNMKAR